MCHSLDFEGKKYIDNSLSKNEAKWGELRVAFSFFSKGMGRHQNLEAITFTWQKVALLYEQFYASLILVIL